MVYYSFTNTQNKYKSFKSYNTHQLEIEYGEGLDKVRSLVLNVFRYLRYINQF